MFDPRLSSIFPRVERPARYTGGEYNSVVKDTASAAVRFAFAFPDVYEIGMSNLGMRILYHVLNNREDTACERVFAPWPDMEAELRADRIPLYALESGDPLGCFDIVGFTLQYEMSYTNILNMLDLAHIPQLSAERAEGQPFVVAGGPCAFNAEPLAPYFDAICVGDGEEAIGDIVEVIKRGKEQRWSRAQTLRELANVPGIYVPSLYEEQRDSDGRFIGLRPLDGVPVVVRKRLLADLDSAPMPDNPIVPYLDITHDRVTLEIFRGCTRGCRFCQAGVLYRPVRERSVETLVRQATAQLKATGYDEVSLSSLSTGDYSRFAELITALRQGPCSGGHISLSVPSLRLDAHAKEFMDTLEGGRRTGLTLAPEAGTQRLRDVINKNVTEEDLLSSVRDAFAAGWDKVKLYFMIGLPGETDEDLLGIVDLAKKVVAEYYKLPKEKRRRGVSVTISTSNFVPKPHTPFQWHAQDNAAELKRKQALLKQALKMPGVDYSWHEAPISLLEGAFARGGREMAPVLRRAWELGCRFDSWREHFRADLWAQAFTDSGKVVEEYCQALSRDGALPWDHIDSGVTKDFLLCEYDHAMGVELTPDCREGCLACGLQDVCAMAAGGGR